MHGDRRCTISNTRHVNWTSFTIDPPLWWIYARWNTYSTAVQYSSLDQPSSKHSLNNNPNPARTLYIGHPLSWWSFVTMATGRRRHIGFGLIKRS